MHMKEYNKSRADFWSHAQSRTPVLGRRWSRGAGPIHATVSLQNRRALHDRTVTMAIKCMYRRSGELAAAPRQK